jgi:hypothetical protein
VGGGVMLGEAAGKQGCILRSAIVTAPPVSHANGADLTSLCCVPRNPIVDLPEGPAFLLANTYGGAKVEGHEKPFSTVADLERLLTACRAVASSPESNDWYLRGRTANNLGAALICKMDFRAASLVLGDAEGEYTAIIDNPFWSNVAEVGLATVRFNLAVSFMLAVLTKAVTDENEALALAEKCRRMGMEVLDLTPTDALSPSREFLWAALEALPTSR